MSLRHLLPLLLLFGGCRDFPDGLPPCASHAECAPARCAPDGRCVTRDGGQARPDEGPADQGVDAEADLGADAEVPVDLGPAPDATPDEGPPDAGMDAAMDQAVPDAEIVPDAEVEPDAEVVPCDACPPQGGDCSLTLGCETGACNDVASIAEALARTPNLGTLQIEACRLAEPVHVEGGSVLLRGHNGQQLAVDFEGADVGVRVSGGSLTLQGLTLQAARQVVRVEGGSLTALDSRLEGGRLGLYVGPLTSATLRGVTINGNTSRAPERRAAGIEVHANARLVLDGCTLTQNRYIPSEVAADAVIGGAIWAEDATVVLQDGISRFNANSVSSPTTAMLGAHLAMRGGTLDAVIGPLFEGGEVNSPQQFEAGALMLVDVDGTLRGSVQTIQVEGHRLSSAGLVYFRGEDAPRAPRISGVRLRGAGLVGDNWAAVHAVGTGFEGQDLRVDANLMGAQVAVRRQPDIDGVAAAVHGGEFHYDENGYHAGLCRDACWLGLSCEQAPDCASGVCLDGHCAPR